MKLHHIIIGAAGLTACAHQAPQPTIDMQGQWDIENIVFNDSTHVRPAEEVPGSRQYITFDSGQYFVQTNCNTLAGSYDIKGDTLTIGDGAMTEIACDNMATEDAFRKFIMQVATIDTENDSITRLNFINSGAYIILHKSTDKK